MWTTTETRLWGGGGASGFLQFTSDTLLFFLDQYKRLQKRKQLLITCPFCALGSVSPGVCFPQMRIGSGLLLLAFICFLLILTRQTFHCAERRECWISEVGASGACWTDFSLALTLSYNQHFPEINKSLQGYMNLRLRRETLIKQLNCQSEVTLKVSLFERKHNGVIFMLTIQSHAWPVGPTAALARMAYNASSSWRAWG